MATILCHKTYGVNIFLVHQIQISTINVIYKYTYRRCLNIDIYAVNLYIQHNNELYNSSKHQPNNVRSVNLLSQIILFFPRRDSNPCYWDIVTPNRLHCSRPARPQDHLGSQKRALAGRVLPFLVSFNLAAYYSTWYIRHEDVMVTDQLNYL